MDHILCRVDGQGQPMAESQVPPGLREWIGLDFCGEEFLGLDFEMLQRKASWRSWIEN